MALVANGFTLRVTVVDNGNNATTLSYDLQGADLAAATANAGDILDALAAVSDGVIKGYAISSDFTNDAFAFPASGVQIEVKAQLVLGITDDITKSATLTIPAPKAACFVATSGEGANRVNGSNPSIVYDYWQLFTAAGKAFISDGETVDTFISGSRITRGSKRG